MTVESLIELLTRALPYVEESEEFNKPSKRTLSKEIRAAITQCKACDGKGWFSFYGCREECQPCNGSGITNNDGKPKQDGPQTVR